MIFSRTFFKTLGAKRALAAGEIQRLQVLQSLVAAELTNAQDALVHLDRLIGMAHPGLDPSGLPVARPGLRSLNPRGLKKRMEAAILETLREHPGAALSTEEISWRLVMQLKLDFHDEQAADAWMRDIAVRQLKAMAVTGVIVESPTPFVAHRLSWWTLPPAVPTEVACD